MTLVALAALLVAATTALVFLIRAGGDPADAATWPITWELRSSDNGPLFQFIQDVVAGRPLDWSFSPQVFVFPELPISAAAFALAGGAIQAYYLWVAVLNDVVLFLVLFALVRVLWRADTVGAAVLRASLAMVPLLVLPLVGTSWILSFHLAPTYYLGMYAALVAAPLVLLTRSRAGRLFAGAALALTIASNPLTLVFAGPGMVAVLVVVVARSGWRSVRAPALWVAGVLVVAGIARLVVSPLQGTSPLSYVNVEVFQERLQQIWPYYAFQARDAAAGLILAAGAVLALLCLAAAVIAAIVLVRRRGTPADPRLLGAVYLGVIPLGGLAATFVVLITHTYYFWPVLVLPFALALLALPRVAVLPSLGAGLVALVVVGLATGGVANLGQVERYLAYRSPETRCIDDALPDGVTLGYATFSDARRVSLTSQTPFRLIPIEPDLAASTWLTNRAYRDSEAGQFFYLNGSGDQPTIDPELLRDEFGEPDVEVSCGDTQSVWVYTNPTAREAIAEYFGVR